MWTRAELKENAKKYFKFNYWKMVLVALVVSMVGGGSGGVSLNINYTTSSQSLNSFNHEVRSLAEIRGFVIGFLVVFLVIFVIALALSAFLFNPLSVGAQRFYVVSHYQKADLGELGYAFSNSYMNVVKTMFLKQLFISLWTMLLIVPGIIKGYEYRMIPYILAENPGIDYKEAFAMSKKMMDGNKWKAFVLDISFFGWILLSVCTCGVLSIFYVNPYMLMTDAELYVALKEITFGNRNSGYQDYQNYQQSGQGYQNYQQPGQGYQNYQQSGQGYQNYQQPGQGYQNYQQPNQGYQNYQQPDQSYQNYEPSQNYQNYPTGSSYQTGRNELQNQGYQDVNQSTDNVYDNNSRDDYSQS